MVQVATENEGQIYRDTAQHLADILEDVGASDKSSVQINHFHEFEIQIHPDDTEAYEKLKAALESAGADIAFFEGKSDVRGRDLTDPTAFTIRMASVDTNLRAVQKIKTSEEKRLDELAGQINAIIKPLKPSTRVKLLERVVKEFDFTVSPTTRSR